MFLQIGLELLLQVIQGTQPDPKIVLGCKTCPFLLSQCLFNLLGPWLTCHLLNILLPHLVNLDRLHQARLDAEPSLLMCLLDKLRLSGPLDFEGFDQVFILGGKGEV